MVVLLGTVLLALSLNLLVSVKMGLKKSYHLPGYKRITVIPQNKIQIILRLIFAFTILQ